MHSQRNAGDFLKQADEASALLPQATRILELRRALHGILPDQLSRSCSIANVKQGKVVVFTENSVIAAKLRLMAPSVCARLSERGQEVTSLEVRVQPPEPEPPAYEKQAHLGEEGAKALKRLEESLPESPLKNALASLARRAKPFDRS